MTCLFVLDACSTAQRLPANKRHDLVTVDVEHTYRNTQLSLLHTDSVHDSIYIREYIRGDTVYVDRWRDRWRDRWHTQYVFMDSVRTDTVVRTETQVIDHPPKPYVPKWCRWGIGFSVVLFVALLVAVIFTVIRRLKRT